MFEKRDLQKGSYACPELTYVLMFVRKEVQAFAAIFRSMDTFLIQIYTTCFPMFLTMKLIGVTLSSFSCNLSNNLPNML